MVCWPRGPRLMKNEVRPITMTALLHCMARVASCSGRARVVEKKTIVCSKRTKKYTKRERGAIRPSVTRLWDNREMDRENTSKKKKNQLPRQKSREQDFISRKRSSQHHWFHWATSNQTNKTDAKYKWTSITRVRASKDEKQEFPRCVMMASAWSQKQPTRSRPDPKLAQFIIPQLDIVVYLLICVAIWAISYSKFNFCFIRSQWMTDSTMFWYARRQLKSIL